MKTAVRRGAWALLLVPTIPLSILATGSAHAQRYLGSINGQVQDPTGAKVPGAEITATEVSTRFVTKVKSDASGAYTMPALNPGTYNVTISAPGFASEARNGVVLTAGQLDEVDFDLKAGATNEVVEVQAGEFTPRHRFAEHRDHVEHAGGHRSS